ncbi:PSP1 domain-containing protein [Thermocrinis sp.]
MLYIKARFKDTRKITQVDGVSEELNRGDLIVVNSEKGEEVVEVLGYSKENLTSSVSFVRKASEEDIAKLKENEKKAQEVHELCKNKIKQYNLGMKLLKTYLPLDGSKVFFYYIAEQRVDFRALVRDLAKVIKKRIEMRQVGVRDAVQMMGWIGNCGNETCCAKFTEQFESVYVYDIHNQNLPLSPSKFTGPCGRLLCCLAYERENYLIKEILPEIGTSFCYQGKEFKLAFVEPLKGYAILEADERKVHVPLEELLPFNYKKALEHCRKCNMCCRKMNIEYEALAGSPE